MGGKCDNKKGDLNWAHPLLRVLGYKRRNDINEGDITEGGVYPVEVQDFQEITYRFF